MKVFNSLKEIAEGLEVKGWEVQKAYEDNSHRGVIFIKGRSLIIRPVKNNLLYIELDVKNSEDYKAYFMGYEKEDYHYKVYVDGIEGTQDCKVLNIDNIQTEIKRATVITDSGTQLNRVFKYVFEDGEVKNDGCIYCYEK